MRVAISITISIVLAACGDAATGPEPADGEWGVDYVEADGALVSVWGSGPDDVWAAGGQVGEGLVLHNDGAGWEPVDTGAHGFVWWIYGVGADHIYAVGEDGLIVHYDGQTWEQVESGTDQTLYGIWGASEDDVWIVGGDEKGEPGSAVVLRGSGRSFEPVADPGTLFPDVIYKIYGFPQRQVIAVGSEGTVLRFDGESWERDGVPTDKPLFSLWGRSSEDVYAVGGHGRGELLHYDGDAWSHATDAPFSAGLSGVYTAPDHPTIAVGSESYVVEIDDGGGAVEPSVPSMLPEPALHGVWGDAAGTTYAVGGDLSRYPEKMGGVILRRRGR